MREEGAVLPEEGGDGADAGDEEEAEEEEGME